MTAALIRIVLADARARLTDPRRWVQGTYAGVRTNHGVIPFYQHKKLDDANCWCLTTALTLAMGKLTLNDHAWTELRSDVERELLTTLDQLSIADNTGRRYSAAYQYNDDNRTSHVDILALIDRTLQRLPEAA